MWRRLNDESLRVAVGLRLGSELCHSFHWICGSVVDSLGTHALSCKGNPGRFQRHHLINDIVWRAVQKAGFPSVKEPHGLVRMDGKRPDGLTLISWREGGCAIWDVTVTDTVTTSYLVISSSITALAAEVEAKRKEAKYIEICLSSPFFLIAFETLGPISEAGSTFISSLGHRIWLVTDDPRDTFLLLQPFSVAVQRFNAVNFTNSFSNTCEQFVDQPKRT